LSLLWGFSEVRVARFSVFCALFWGKLFVLFSFFCLAIVFSVFQLTDSDYPFGIFKLLFIYIHRMSPEKKEKKGGGVEYLKRYIYCRSIWRFIPSGDKVYSFFIRKVSFTFLYFIYFTITPTNVSAVVETVHSVSICHIMTYILGNR
jgi:hypothetical protein